MAGKLKQFRLGSCLSYLVWDEGSSDALLLDPRAELSEDYAEFAARRRLKIAWAEDTHLHADHYSGVGRARRRFGAQALGERDALGGLPIRRLELGGHSERDLCLQIGPVLFLGDLVFPGSVGRCDQIAAGGATERLFESVRRLRELPPDTPFHSAHDVSGLLFSTLGTELGQSPQFRCDTLEEFRELKDGEHLDQDREGVAGILGFNRAGPGAEPPASPPGEVAPQGAPIEIELGRPGSLSPDKFADRLKRPAPGELFLDIREPDEFALGHIAGMRNLPLWDLAFRWDELRAASRIILSCQSGRRSQLAGRTLVQAGLASVTELTGGYLAWLASGRETTA